MCGTPDGHLDTTKMRILGILWCKGENHEKVRELYYVIQDNGQEEVAASDHDFKPSMFRIFDLATIMPIEQE